MNERAANRLLLYITIKYHYWNFKSSIGVLYYFLLCKKKKKPVDFDGKLKTGDVRYDNLTKITIKVQLF